MKKILCTILIILMAWMTCFLVSAEDAAVVTADPAADCDVHARAYCLMDVNTGTLLAAAHEHERLYPASVTKIMTLLLVCEAIEAGKLSPDQIITCSDMAAQKGGSQIWLEAGEQMTVDELLKAAAVYSANDACALLGETIAGSEKAFVAMMNEKAQQLGMKDTTFVNCTGLDDDTTEHLSSAYDVALMSCALLKHEMIKKYTVIWMDSLRGGETQLVNTNKLIRTYPGATGLKTGTTSKAGCCVSASAERDGLGLVAVVLGASNSNDRFAGARNLLDFGFAGYEIYTPQPDLSRIADIPVAHGTKASVSVTCAGTSDILLNKGIKNNITQTVTTTESLEAPVAEGQKIGTLKFMSGSTLLASYDLTAGTAVEKMTLSKALFALLCAFAKK